MDLAITKILEDYIQSEAAVFLLHCDWDGNVMDANDFTVKMIGFEPAGKNLSEIFLDFTHDMTISELVGEKSERLFNITTYVGLPQTLYFRFYKLNDGYLILGRHDVLVEEKLRREVLELNNELNSLMRQLHKQNSELEKLNKLKDQFLGMAAHDLRKPVGVILNFAEFLEEELSGVFNAEQAAFMERIKKSSLFMRKIINDFLDVALIEAGQFKLDKSLIELNSLVQEHIQQHQIMGKKSGIKVELMEELPGEMVECDVSKIEQVLNNLIGNAIEHSEAGGKVSIHLAKRDSYLHVSVKDTGAGISQDKQKEIFDIFGKDRKKLRGKKSIGLGLAISKKIIESHSGELWVDSKMGEGAIFSFSLLRQKKEER
jgi:signal transduction histidine kinase